MLQGLHERTDSRVRSRKPGIALLVLAIGLLGVPVWAIANVDQWQGVWNTILMAGGMITNAIAIAFSCFYLGDTRRTSWGVLALLAIIATTAPYYYALQA